MGLDVLTAAADTETPAEYLDQSARALRLRLYGDALPADLVVLDTCSTEVAGLSVRAAVLSASHLVEIGWTGECAGESGRTSEVLVCGDLSGGSLLYDRAAFDPAREEEPVNIDLAWHADARTAAGASRGQKIGYHGRVEVLGWRKAESIISALRGRIAGGASSSSEWANRLGLAYRFPDPNPAQRSPSLNSMEEHVAAETLLCVSVDVSCNQATVEIESLHGYPNESRFVFSRSRFVLGPADTLNV